MEAKKDNLVYIGQVAWRNQVTKLALNPTIAAAICI